MSFEAVLHEVRLKLATSGSLEYRCPLVVPVTGGRRLGVDFSTHRGRWSPSIGVVSAETRGYGF